MKYPCIVYEISGINSIKADNIKYNINKIYEVKYISKDPNNDAIIDIPDMFDNCYYERRYSTNNLVHDVFRLYF